MCKIISIANQKGGVGKTTTSVNLATGLAYEGKKVLVLDIDPQGNATGSMGINRGEIDSSVYNLMIDYLDPVDAIKPSNVEGVDVIPSTVDLYSIDEKLYKIEDRDFILSESLNSIRHNYDYILIDCPPSVGLMTINALCASDSVIVPVQCEYYALEGLTQVLNTIRTIQKKLKVNKRNLDLEGILLTMLDRRTVIGAKVVTEARKYFNEKVFKTVIPRNVTAQVAPSYGMPVLKFDPKAIVSKMYLSLAQEVVANEA